MNCGYCSVWSHELTHASPVITQPDTCGVPWCWLQFRILGWSVRHQGLHSLEMININLNNISLHSGSITFPNGIIPLLLDFLVHCESEHRFFRETLQTFPQCISWLGKAVWLYPWVSLSFCWNTLKPEGDIRVSVHIPLNSGKASGKFAGQLKLLSHRSFDG